MGRLQAPRFLCRKAARPVSVLRGHRPAARDRRPGVAGLVVCVPCFAGLAGSLYPCLVAPAITIAGGRSAGGMPVFALAYKGYHSRLSGGKVTREYAEMPAPREDSRGVS